MESSGLNTCWQCGTAVNYSTENLVYGFFNYGIVHKNCKRRIEAILKRSLSALECFFKKEHDKKIPENVVKTLIQTSAKVLDNKPLFLIPEDKTISSIVESYGFNAAIEQIKQTTTLNQKQWDKALRKSHLALTSHTTHWNLNLILSDTLATATLNDLFNKKLKEVVYDIIINRLPFETENKQFVDQPYEIVCVLLEFITEKLAFAEIKTILTFFEQKTNYRIIFLANEKRNSKKVVLEYLAFIANDQLLSLAKDAWFDQCIYREDCEPIIFLLNDLCKSNRIFLEAKTKRFLVDEFKAKVRSIEEFLASS